MKKFLTGVFVLLFISIFSVNSILAGDDFIGEWIGLKETIKSMCGMSKNISIKKRGGMYLVQNSGGLIVQKGMRCFDSEMTLYKDKCLVSQSLGFTACRDGKNLIFNIAEGEFMFVRSGESSKESKLEPMANDKKLVNKPSRELLEKEAKWLVIDFYNNRGEWAGVFKIDSIEKIRIEQFNPGKYNIHAKYNFKAIPGNTRNRTDSGMDQRVFIVEWSGEAYIVTNMKGYNSAVF